MVWHCPHSLLSDSKAGKQTHLLSPFIIAERWANSHQESRVAANWEKREGTAPSLQLLQERGFVHEQELTFIRQAFQPYGPNPRSPAKLPG